MRRRLRELRSVLPARSRIRRTRGSHLAIQLPGVDGEVFTPATPSDRRALHRLLSDVRRALARGTTQRSG
jgi:hypothetical protein